MIPYNTIFEFLEDDNNRLSSIPMAEQERIDDGLKNFFKLSIHSTLSAVYARHNWYKKDIQFFKKRLQSSPNKLYIIEQKLADYNCKFLSGQEDFMKIERNKRGTREDIYWAFQAELFGLGNEELVHFLPYFSNCINVPVADVSEDDFQNALASVLYCLSSGIAQAKHYNELEQQRQCLSSTIAPKEHHLKASATLSQPLQFLIAKKFYSEGLREFYKELLNKALIAKGSSYSSFECMFGMKQKNKIQTVHWIGTNSQLKYLIQNLRNKEVLADPIWPVTAQWFVDKKGMSFTKERLEKTHLPNEKRSDKLSNICNCIIR